VKLGSAVTSVDASGITLAFGEHIPDEMIPLAASFLNQDLRVPSIGRSSLQVTPLMLSPAIMKSTPP
jgi:hypothetical protein